MPDYTAPPDDTVAVNPDPDVAPPVVESQPQPAVDPFEAAYQETKREKDQAFRQSMFVASDQDPDAHAKALKLADEFKIPVGVLEASRNAFGQAEKLSAVDTDTLLKLNPRLTSWLLNHDNAVIAQDDLHHLKRIDDASAELGRMLSVPMDTREDAPWMQTMAGHGRVGAFGFMDAVLAPIAVVEMAGRSLFNVPISEERVNDPGWSAAATIINDQQRIRDQDQALQTYRESLPQKAVGGVVSLVANPANVLLPVAGFKVAAAGVEGLTAARAGLNGLSLVMAEQTAIQTLQEQALQHQHARMAGDVGMVGFTPADVGNAVVQGGVAYLGGYISGLRGMFRGLNPAPVGWRDVVADTGIMTATGTGQGMAATLAAGAILPDQHVNVGEMLESGIVAGFGGFALGSSGALFHIKAQELAIKTQNAQDATIFAGALAKLGMANVNSKAFIRNGSRILDLSKSAIGSGNGLVYFQAEDLTPLAEAVKVPVEVMRERLGISTQEFAQAVEAKTPLSVDVFKAMSEVARGGQEAVAVAADKFRAQVQAPNLEDAQAFAKTLPAEYEAIQKEIDAAAQGGVESRELMPTEKVHEDVRRQLIDAGMTPERADANAALWASRYGARAYWWNRTLAEDAPNRMDPFTEYQKNPVTIQRQLPGVVTAPTSELGAKIKAERIKRGQDWASQDRAMAELTKGHTDTQKAQQVAIVDRAASDEGDRVVADAIAKLKADVHGRRGGFPITMLLGKEYGFATHGEDALSLTPAQRERGAILITAMKQRGFSLELLADEAGGFKKGELVGPVAGEKPTKAQEDAEAQAINFKDLVTTLRDTRQKSALPEAVFASRLEQARDLAKQVEANIGITKLGDELNTKIDEALKFVKEYKTLGQRIKNAIGLGPKPESVPEPLGKKPALPPKELPEQPRIMPTEAEVTESAKQSLLESPFEEVAAAYRSHHESNGGQEINADVFRDLIPAYNQSGATMARFAGATHDAVKIITEKYWQHQLADQNLPGRKTVVFLAGGAASGKGSGMRMAGLGEKRTGAQIVLDGTFSNRVKAKQKVEEALLSGRSVEIYHIHRDVKKAVFGMIKRAIVDKKWRTVPIKTMVEDHVKAQLTTLRLAELFKEDPRVTVHVVDNNGENVPAKVADLALLKRELYAKINPEGGYDDNAIKDAVERIITDIWPQVERTTTDPDVRVGAGLVESTSQSVVERGSNDAGGDRQGLPTGDTGRLPQGGDTVTGTLRQELRGSYEPERNIVRLFEAENLSTFAHESGHAFLEMMRADALREDAPANIKSDWEIVKEFTKADGDTLKEAHHETFARAWEAYLQEGKAPSTGLLGVFQRFAAWMAITYKNLAGITKAAGHEVKLSPEIRGVMDRMLASQEEIEAAQTLQNQAALFADSQIAKSMGMDAANTQEYLDTVAKARDAASQTFMAQELKREESRKKALASDAYKKIEGEVRAEVEAQPIYRAIDNLKNRAPGPNGEVNPGLDREAIGAWFRDSGVPGEQKAFAHMSRMGVLADKGTAGIHPDLLAPLYGYDSGDALVRAIIEARPKEAFISAESKIRLRENHPDLLPSRGDIQEQAQRAIHGKERGAVLRQELIQLGRKVGETTSSKWADDRQNVRRATAEKRVAAEAVGKLRPDKFRNAERKAAGEALEKTRKAAKAEADGKSDQASKLFGEAYLAKQREAFNYELNRAAENAVETAGKIAKDLKRLADPSAQQRIGKAGGWDWTVAYPDGTTEKFSAEELAKDAAKKRPGSKWQQTSGYLDQINTILERYNMKPLSARQIQRRQTMEEWQRMMEEQGFPVEPFDLPDPAGKQSWNELTLDELQAVHDSVIQIEHLARMKNKFLAAKNKAEFDAARDELALSIVAKAKGTRSIKAGESLTKGMQVILDGLTGSLERFGDLVQHIDGFEPGGPMWELLKRPMDEAANREAELNATDTAELHRAFAEWEKAGGRGRVRDLWTKDFIKDINQSLSRLERVMVALQWGNEGNRARLMQGFGWNEKQVDTILSSLDDADVQLVKGIAKLVNSHWSDSAAQQQRITGIRPEKVEGSDFQVNGKTIEGFYFPIIYDHTQSSAAVLRNLQEAADGVRRGSFIAATTRKGYLKARSEGTGAPLALDPHGISRHLNQVIHTLTHQEALIDANRIMRDQKVKDAIETHYGPQTVVALAEALRRIGGATVRDVDGLERGLRVMTRNVGRMAMGYNVWTAVQNVTGITQSMERVGPLRYMRAMASLVGSADGQQSLRQLITGKSEFMARRFKLAGQHQREETSRGAEAVGRDLPAALRPYSMMEGMQFLVDAPTWKAEYDHMLENGHDDAKAVMLADQAVVDAQSGKDIKDRAAILEGHEFKKTLTAFYSYFNSTFNLSRRAVLKTNFTDPASVATLARSFLLLYSIPTAITLAGMSLLRPNDKRDGKPLPGRFTYEMLAMMASTIPGVREFGAGLKGDRYGGPAGMRGFETVNRLLLQLHQGSLDQGLGHAATDLLGIATGLPTTQAQRTLDGLLYDIDHQKPNPIAPLFGSPK